MRATPINEVGVTVRMTRDQHEQLRVQARREHRSISQELRRMLDLYLGEGNVTTLHPPDRAA